MRVGRSRGVLPLCFVLMPFGKKPLSSGATN
jgi:hypothetical protein